MMDLHQRCREDKKFAQLVDMMTHYIVCAEFTPSEMRIAALLAAIQAENYNIKKYVTAFDERSSLFSRLDLLSDQVNRMSKEQKL